ncbi:hypothetical protein [Nocardia arthritidis]|uniref:TPR repeat domain-containing protein n=1 Tax=Nocardia arthritidis TaxID=228602 RepID=A0A6G9YBZ6_9NOCA|nr:hypothetical protein [Nocardia arthritidis]QIS10597.1 hypothetical protein F5544_13540 [Nocardia arthritidis]
MTPQTALEWLRVADPGILSRFANSWDQIGTGLEKVFERYSDSVARVNGTHWEGKAAEAAQNRAAADLKTMQFLADKLGALANEARKGEHLISEPLQRAKGYLNQCTHNCWSVTPDLRVSGNADAKVLADVQNNLQAAAREAMQADTDVRDMLNKARAEVALAFASAAALGADQGKSDIEHLLKDPQHLTDAEIDRLMAAGHLTGEQIFALQAGQPVQISASQMRYLTAISRALDGKSPQEIAQLMDKLPANVRSALANSLQLVSNAGVRTGVKDSQIIPEHGGLNLLPNKIQESLNRNDLVTSHWDYLGGAWTSEIRLNGVADNQAIAKIAGSSEANYRAGSDLDKKVLDVAARYLHAQTEWEQAPNHKLIGFNVDGGDSRPERITEDMFKAVGNDKAAVLGLVAGPDGTPNREFLHDALTHKWTDGGEAVSTLFTPYHDNNQNFGSPQVTAVEHRQGAIMSAVAQYMSEDSPRVANKDDGDPLHLYDIPNTDHKSIGQVNPKLVQTLSASMAPYVDDLIHPADNGDGFKVSVGNNPNTSWTDPHGNNTFTGSRNVFSLLDTDETAGKNFNAAALAKSLQHEHEFGQNPAAPDARQALLRAGQLQGLVDSGLRGEVGASIVDKDQIAQDIYNHKKTAFDTIKAVVGLGIPIGDGDSKITVQVPGGDAVSKVLSVGGDTLKDAIIGPAPIPHSTDVPSNPPNFEGESYNVLQTTAIPESLRAKYHALFNGDQLLPFQDIRRHGDEGQLTALLNELGDRDGHGNAIREGYDDTTRK